ncbi:K(+)-transporting ATPase subunit F [Clostridium sp. Ade.TY]|nr:K(+)-transporting ATPase subunit F [Clostridium sp. Ade.TY]
MKFIISFIGAVILLLFVYLCYVLLRGDKNE